jgi:hypothetical protein
VSLFLDAFDLVDDLGKQFGQLTRRVDNAIFRDFEHLRLGLIERFGNVVGPAEGKLGDIPRNADELSQQGVVLNDFGVARRVRHRGRGAGELHKNRAAADGVEQPSPAKFFGDCDGIDGLAAGQEHPDGFVDVLMRGLVEVVWVEPELGNGAYCISREQHGAEE